MAFDRSTALAALAASVPATVRRVCETLTAAGHSAFTVGGAVRDALLGRTPGDWDVTTSAMPDEVMGLFRKTIPTGLEHGTVTVMVGRGEQRMGIEVTTFRGDGAYTDGRRPDEVIFGVSLEEDLARRDFVINALAYDPVTGELADPLGGVADIEARLIRAVGVAADRFTEDGLRVMRAVRFVAVLDFHLEAATEEALSPALPSLAKVAQERVRVELFKLLAAPAAVRALAIARDRGVLSTAVPLSATLAWPGAIDRVGRSAADPGLRLAALFAELAIEGRALDELEDALRTLTLSNEERNRVMAALRHLRPAEERDLPALRALLGRATRKAIPDLIALWRVIGNKDAERAEAIVADNDALVIGDLAVRGVDVMEVLDIGPSRQIGDVLAALLAEVHADPGLNTRDALIERIRETTRPLRQ